MPAPEGTSSIVWLVAIIATPLITGTVSIIIALITRRDTKAELSAAREHIEGVQSTANSTLEQVQNTHVTNLRDDVDDLSRMTREGLAAIRDDVGGLHSETRDLRNDVLGIRTDARRDRRKLGEQEKALDDHLAEIPDILERAFADHASDCLLRRTADPGTT